MILQVLLCTWYPEQGGWTALSVSVCRSASRDSGNRLQQLVESWITMVPSIVQLTARSYTNLYILNDPSMGSTLVRCYDTHMPWDLGSMETTGRGGSSWKQARARPLYKWRGEMWTVQVSKIWTMSLKWPKRGTLDSTTCLSTSSWKPWSTSLLLLHSSRALDSLCFSVKALSF